MRWKNRCQNRIGSIPGELAYGSPGRSRMSSDRIEDYRLLRFESCHSRAGNPRRAPSKPFRQVRTMHDMKNSRRRFLKTALAGGAGAIFVPTLLPSHLLGATAPSARVALGHIGVGG
ncbi:twin-arginine translocation signal domain-containing protein, partial [bacterium]|nr:twin-arginine translocation signal domain-containing protein [bacterium]